MLAGHLALMIAALFTGAAFYINFAEQPARLGLDDRALLAQWKPAYRRGFAMQAPLAFLGFVLAIVAWWLTDRLAFISGGILLLANWPWTYFGIMPTNKVLMATEQEGAGLQSRALIVKWNRLHSVRTALGCFAILAFLIALGSDCTLKPARARPSGTSIYKMGESGRDAQAVNSASEVHSVNRRRSKIFDLIEACGS
jgi:hypothetical protein